MLILLIRLQSYICFYYSINISFNNNRIIKSQF